MVSNCRALQEIACVDLRKACQRTAELKREADATHERTQSHRERCRRAAEHTKSEAATPNFGCLGLACQRDRQRHTLSEMRGT